MLSACGKDNHEYTYSDQWSYNQTDHWHGATCEHTDKKKDIVAHKDSNNDGKYGTLKRKYLEDIGLDWTIANLPDYLYKIHEQAYGMYNVLYAKLFSIKIA